MRGSLQQTVAVIGLGRMGGAMARRIHAAGFGLVVWNRDPRKAAAAESSISATVARTPAEAAATADITLTSLADDEALQAVYLGDDGVAAGISGDAAAVDTSTVDPETIRRIGRTMDEIGAAFADCPVSGSVSSVEAGTLTVMAGGEPEHVDRVEPVLASFAQRIIRVGPRGAGATCKLAVNGLVHGLNVALSEALVLAERAGVDRTTAYEVFASGAGGAPFVQYKRQAYEHPESAPVAFSLDLVGKDLELITGLGDRVGAPMDQAKAGLDIVRRAIGAGMGGEDLSAVAVFLRKELT